MDSGKQPSAEHSLPAGLSERKVFCKAWTLVRFVIGR